MELRNRFNNNNKDRLKIKENVNDRSNDTKHINKSIGLFRTVLYILFLISGFVICFMVSKHYSRYLKQSHENALWFSKIKVFI